MFTLNELIAEVHRALTTAGLDHAFGGALALMHNVAEPRMTRDIDVNVFVGTDEAARVLKTLSHLAPVADDDVTKLVEDGFVRLVSDIFPIDVFLSTDEFHYDMRPSVEMHRVGQNYFPYISATHLAVLKAMFDRPKDWVDILEMLRHGTVDVPKAVGWLVQILGHKDERPARLRALALVGPEVAISPKALFERRT